MNIAIQQEWLDMPLGDTEKISTAVNIIRVPGGWVMTVYSHPVFVPEPQKAVYWPKKDIFQRIKEQGFISGQDLNRLRESEGFSGYKGPYPEPIPCNQNPS